MSKHHHHHHRLDETLVLQSRELTFDSMSNTFNLKLQRIFRVKWSEAVLHTETQWSQPFLTYSTAVAAWMQMRHVSDLCLSRRQLLTEHQVALVKVEKLSPACSTSQSMNVKKRNSGENRGGKRGEGLAAGVLAVYSGIYYLACLKINQRLPQFPAHGASKFYHILLLPLSRSISEGLLNLLHVKITQVHRQAMCKTCRRCTKKREWHPSKQGIIKFKHCGSPCKEQKNNCVTPPWTQKQTQTAIQNIVIEGFKTQKWEKNESSPWKSKL